MCIIRADIGARTGFLTVIRTIVDALSGKHPCGDNNVRRSPVHNAEPCTGRQIMCIPWLVRPEPQVRTKEIEMLGRLQFLIALLNWQFLSYIEPAKKIFKADKNFNTLAKRNVSKRNG